MAAHIAKAADSEVASSSIHTQVTAVMAAGGDVAAVGRGAPIRGH